MYGFLNVRQQFPQEEKKMRWKNLQAMLLTRSRSS